MVLLHLNFSLLSPKSAFSAKLRWEKRSHFSYVKGFVVVVVIVLFCFVLQYTMALASIVGNWFMKIGFPFGVENIWT